MIVADGSDNISFHELLSGLSTILHGSVEDRIHVMFAVYDMYVRRYDAAVFL